MKKCITISILIMLVLAIFLTGCNSVVPQNNNGNNKSLNNRQVNSYIKKNNIGNVLSIDDIGNKYTNILVKNNNSEFTCYTLSSIYGRIIEISESTETYELPLPDVIISYSSSEPHFILIIINNANITNNSDKLKVTYWDTKDSMTREIIEPVNHRKYITLSYNNLNEFINNISDIEIYDKYDKKLYSSRNNVNN